MASEMRRLYAAGASIRTLSREYGRSYGAVHRMLSEAGVELRGRGGGNNSRQRNDKRGAKRLSPEQIHQYRERLLGS